MPHKLRLPESGLREITALLFILVLIVSCTAQDIQFCSYLGGMASDKGYGIGIDTQGNCYLAGMTSSSDFPIENPFDSTFNGLWDAFATKVSASGNHLDYSTYIGGVDGAQGYDIAVDHQGCAYITGKTNSNDFPVAGPYHSVYGGGGDAFITKFAPDGRTLIYSILIGGSGEDWGQAIAVDSLGSAYVVGNTVSTDFPTINALDSTYNGDSDILVLKISPAGDDIEFSTFLGGSNDDYAVDIAIDMDLSIYVTGRTLSSDFPQVNPCQVYGGQTDIIAAKVAAPYESITYSTFIGGSSNEQGQGMAVTNDHKAIMTGWTTSSDFPTTGAFDNSYNNSRDAFITMLSSDGGLIEYSTYLGGINRDEANGIALDNTDNIIIAGETCSDDFPLESPIDGNLRGNSDAFICRFEYPGIVLAFSTYYGGRAVDIAEDVAVDDMGNMYVVGSTSSADIPVLNPFDSFYGGAVDVFYLKIGFATEIIFTDDPPLSGLSLECYPNPCNAQTAIEYALPEQAYVQLTIYDIQGRLVETLVDGEQPAGHHQVIWRAKNTPSGVYLYKLTAGDYSETRKMLLLK